MKLFTLLAFAFLLPLAATAKEIKTEIIIRATPEKIWTILTYFDTYPEWNPFIVSIKGDVAKGKKITVTIHPLDEKMITFKPVVLTRIENKELSWQGRFLFKGLFDGKHTFELVDNGDGTTTFIQKEEFKGALVWMFHLKNIEKGFGAMNQKLKELAEK